MKEQQLNDLDVDIPNKQKLLGLLSVAADKIKDGGGIEVTAFLEKRDGDMEMMIFPQIDDFAKKLTVMILKKQMETGNYVSYTLLNEAWMSTCDKKEPDFKVRPRDDPNRKEILVLSHKNDKGEGCIIIQELVRLESRIEFKEPIVKDGEWEGLFNFWK